MTPPHAIVQSPKGTCQSHLLPIPTIDFSLKTLGSSRLAFPQVKPVFVPGATVSKVCLFAEGTRMTSCGSGHHICYVDK